MPRSGSKTAGTTIIAGPRPMARRGPPDSANYACCVEARTTAPPRLCVLRLVFVMIATCDIRTTAFGWYASCRNNCDLADRACAGRSARERRPPQALLRPRPADWYFDRASALLWLANARGSCSPPTSPPPEATSCDMRHGNSSGRLLACSHDTRPLKKGFTDVQIHDGCDRYRLAHALFRAIQYGNNKC